MYPYNYIYVSRHEGSRHDFFWEYFLTSLVHQSSFLKSFIIVHFDFIGYSSKFYKKLDQQIKLNPIDLNDKNNNKSKQYFYASTTLVDINFVLLLSYIYYELNYIRT